MELLVTGVARYRASSGFGILKREHWDEEKFQVTMGAGDTATPVSELEVRCVSVPNGLALEGTLRKQRCYFTEITSTLENLHKNFMMVSVAGIELRCRVEAVKEGPQHRLAS